MAIETTASLSSNASWQQTSTDGHISSTDIGSFSSDTFLGSGTGSSQINSVWHATGSLAAYGTGNFDLTSLTLPVLGTYLDQSFVDGNIKAFQINNLETEQASSFTLVATGSNGWSEPFAGSGRVSIHPESSLHLTHSTTGWPVNVTNKEFELVDGGGGASYEIVFMGATGL